MTDRLRPLWDFDDLDRTEARFRTLLGEEASPAVRAEVLTQLARVDGLRGAFDEGHRLLDEAAELGGSDPLVETRIGLERGRLLRSSGDVAASLPAFKGAVESALTAGATFIAADAAHMAALAAPDRNGMIAWTRRGIDIAGSDPAAGHWLGPLWNNLGWAYFEDREYEAARAAFTSALEAYEREGDETAVDIARYAVGKSLRALGRPAEAAPLLEQAVARAESKGKPDGWFHEELVEIYVALDRQADAGEQARRALPLLPEADPSFGGTEREARLRRLAGPL